MRNNSSENQSRFVIFYTSLLFPSLNEQTASASWNFTNRCSAFIILNLPLQHGPYRHM